MVHVKARNTDNPVVGQSPLRAAGASIANAVETYGLQKSLFHNLANVGMSFSTDMDLTAEQMRMLRERVDRQTKGFAAGGSIILINGLRLDRGGNGTKAADEELVGALEFSVREIARVYGIPPSMLAQASESSYATAAEERRAFLTSTLEPWAARVANELSMKLLTAEDRTAGVRVAYDFASALLGHGAERADTLSKLVNAGILSVNESRNLMGMADAPGGDVLRSPVNTYPMDAWLDFAPPQEGAEEPQEAAEEPDSGETAEEPTGAAGDAPEDEKSKAQTSGLAPEEAEE